MGGWNSNLICSIEHALVLDVHLLAQHRALKANVIHLLKRRNPASIICRRWSRQCRAPCRPRLHIDPTSGDGTGWLGFDAWELLLKKLIHFSKI